MDHYFDAANRMYISSKLLYNNGAHHNACYLGGYVIECYTKIIIETFSTSTQTPRSFGHNVQNLNTAIQEILRGNTTLSSYIANGSTDFATILNKWQPISIRYVPIGDEINESIICDSFQIEIELAMRKMAKLKLDGHI